MARWPDISAEPVVNHAVAGMKNQVRAIRESRKLSLRELEKLTGIGHTIISKIETGKVRLASHHMERLALALKCSPEDLVSKQPLTDRERRLLRDLRNLTDERIETLIGLVKEDCACQPCSQS